MKKTLCLILALLTLGSLCTACAGKSGDDKTTTAAAVTTAPQQDDPASEDTFVKDDLPDDLDFDGETITVFVHPYNTVEIIDFAENDVVSAAVVKRNQAVEERLKLRIEPVYDENESSEAYNARLIKNVMSGDNSFQLVLSTQYVLCMSQHRGIFYNMNDCDYIDLEKPWWADLQIESVKVRDDLLYQLYGDAAYSTISCLACVYMNKSIVTDTLGDVGVDGIYQLALDGKWTMDRLYEFAKTSSADLDGNQIMDADDRFGLLLFDAEKPMMLGAGLEMTFRDEFGEPYLDLSGDHNVEVFDTLIRVFSDSDTTVTSFAEWESRYQPFLNDRGTFIVGELSTSYEKLRTMESEYGILPIPKLNELQSDYRSRGYLEAGAYCVSSLMSDDDANRYAAFLEAMGSASHRLLMPAYYEKALKTKYTHDNLSSKVIDIIHDTAYADFCDIYGDKTDNPIEKLEGLLRSSENNYASTSANVQTACEKTLEKYLKKFEKMS